VSTTFFLFSNAFCTSRPFPPAPPKNTHHTNPAPGSFHGTFLNLQRHTDGSLVARAPPLWMPVTYSVSFSLECPLHLAPYAQAARLSSGLFWWAPLGLQPPFRFVRPLHPSYTRWTGRFPLCCARRNVPFWFFSRARF